jgi:hypothetical protein
VTTLPQRPGARPRTTPETPHQQLDQQPADPTVLDRLAERILARPGIHAAGSAISLPGARAFVANDPPPGAPRDAFITGTEFAHIHAAPDLSLHAALPETLARDAVASGWAEPHPMAGRDGFGAGLSMIYAPRDDAEAAVIEQLIDAAYRRATGRLDRPPAGDHVGGADV